MHGETPLNLIRLIIKTIRNRLSSIQRQGDQIYEGVTTLVWHKNFIPSLTIFFSRLDIGNSSINSNSLGNNAHDVIKRFLVEYNFMLTKKDFFF